MAGRAESNGRFASSHGDSPQRQDVPSLSAIRGSLPKGAWRRDFQLALKLIF
jgi:hypothetical protein